MKNLYLLALLLMPVPGMYAQYGNANVEEGIAVFYADDLHGQATAYGEVYRREGFTAAHPYYPPGTIVRVSRPDNGMSVEVRVNDKMLPDAGRKIILSRAAALQIDLIRFGKAWVRIERLSGGNDNPAYTERGKDNPYRNNIAASSFSSAPPLSSYDHSSSARSGAVYPRNPYGSAPSPGEAAAAYNAPLNARASADAVYNSGLALPAGASGYAIQLASYKEGVNAVSNANKLQQLGLRNIYIWQKDGNNRVVAASFPDKGSADSFLADIRRQYLVDGIIVQLR